MTKTKTAKMLMGLAVLPALLLLSACNSIEKDSTSSSFMVVESILGVDESGAEANYLASDVVDTSTSTPTVYADPAAVTLRAAMYTPASNVDPTQYNDLILDRYVVSYSRTDGKSVQGVDVPFSFEASLTKYLTVGESSTVSIVVVREVAKLEAPLYDLRDKRAEGVIEMTATIDFYGHDLTNHTVHSTGYLSIRFANFADSATTSAGAIR
jgi:hypothetical protein